MRPLAVLILILFAIAALVFAFASLSDRGAEPPVVQAPSRAATAPEGRPNEKLDQVQPTGPTLLPQGEQRTAVETGPEEVKGAFKNYIAGKVQNPEGAPLAGATVSLEVLRVHCHRTDQEERAAALIQRVRHDGPKWMTRVLPREGRKGPCTPQVHERADALGIRGFGDRRNTGRRGIGVTAHHPSPVWYHAHLPQSSGQIRRAFV